MSERIREFVVRSPKNPIRVQKENRGEIVAHQSFADESNINKLMERWKRTGTVPQQTAPPHYGDFTNAGDYLEACNQVVAAQQAFNTLPAEIRYRFENSPYELLFFLEDPNNLEEAYELGILERPEAPVEAQAEPPVEEPSE